jgi:hypothetical protein
MKKIARQIQRYHLYIPNPYNLVYNSGQSHVSKPIIKQRALYFRTEGVYYQIMVSATMRGPLLQLNFVIL